MLCYNIFEGCVNMDILQSIRSRCSMLLAAAVINDDKKRIKKLSEIEKFLKNDNCFVGASSIDSMYVLLELGYNLDQVNEIYNSFNQIDVLSGLLEYVDESGNVVSVEALLCPSIEDYYKFKDGMIFKFNKNEQCFYYLIDGKWKYNGELQRKFYDTSYDYDSIGYKIITKDSPRR